METKSSLMICSDCRILHFHSICTVHFWLKTCSHRTSMTPLTQKNVTCEQALSSICTKCYRHRNVDRQPFYLLDGHCDEKNGCHTHFAHQRKGNTGCEQSLTFVLPEIKARKNRSLQNLNWGHSSWIKCVVHIKRKCLLSNWGLYKVLFSLIWFLYFNGP